MYSWLWRGLVLASLVLAGPALAAWQGAVPGARLLGSGELNAWGLRIYTARLWSAQPHFAADRPFALEIIYHRAISRERLVAVSIDEMRRLSAQGFANAQLEQWQAQMRLAFVDVEAGARITGVYLPGQGCRFYVGERLQHEIRDEAFARAFFAIWLDPRTRQPQLRQQLLGDSP